MHISCGTCGWNVLYFTVHLISFVLTSPDRERCMYWLPLVVGMNTALQFGNLTETCLHITLIE